LWPNAGYDHEEWQPEEYYTSQEFQKYVEERAASAGEKVISPSRGVIDGGFRSVSSADQTAWGQGLMVETGSVVTREELIVRLCAMGYEVENRPETLWLIGCSGRLFRSGSPSDGEIVAYLSSTVSESTSLWHFLCDDGVGVDIIG